MTNVDDELEEIKRLIADEKPSPPTSQPSAKNLVKARPGQVVPAVSKKQANVDKGVDYPLAPVKPEQKRLSGPSSGERKLAPAKPRDVSSAPSRSVSSAPSRSVSSAPSRSVSSAPSRSVSSAPSKPVSNQPATPQPRQDGVLATPRRPAPPSTVRAEDIIDVREYDISQSGKISTQYDISQSGKVKTSTATESEIDMGDDDFDVNFDFDGEYMDVPESRPIRLRREKRTGCVGGILYAAFVICVGLVLASLLWMATVDVLGFGAVDEPVNVTIPADFTIDRVADILYEAGLIRHRFLFNLYANFSNAEERITPGQFVLNMNFDYRALVQGMTARAGVRVETTVTIPEGFTMAQIFTLLEDHAVVDSASDLWEAATYHPFNFHFLDEETIGDRLRLEGFLFPETYNFFIGSQPVTVLNRFLREFNRRFTEEFVERAEEMGMSVRDIVNVAAMVEREAGDDAERARIAAVIYNRLASPNFPFLQIDATIYYAVMGTDIPATLDLDHPFNTYLFPGLPPGPIANPGIASIRAALYPLRTNEYFYALNLEGTHNFFRTYAEHRAFVNSDQFGGWWR